MSLKGTLTAYDNEEGFYQADVEISATSIDISSIAYDEQHTLKKVIEKAPDDYLSNGIKFTNSEGRIFLAKFNSDTYYGEWVYKDLESKVTVVSYLKIEVDDE